MEFRILSHAGLQVHGQNKTLLCDPWLVGSCYWRSWWNYPPPNGKMITSLVPDVIYLTHIHWDHFHGPSLKLFSRDTLFVVPEGHFDRIKDDLRKLGFCNVRELPHGGRYEIDDDFVLTSYAFEMFLDSAVVIECEGTTLLNLNDSKHMGLTLRQITSNHPKIDFAFRSHSSANERLCYRIVDGAQKPQDDLEFYVKHFADTVLATGARYAIPFASNHCHLHKDSWHFNDYIQTPQNCAEYFRLKGYTTTEVKVMLSGDSWSNESGFKIAENDWFENRGARLSEYRDRVQHRLDEFYELEDATRIDETLVSRCFERLAARTPWIVRRQFKNAPFLFVLFNHGRPNYLFLVDMCRGTVQRLNIEDTNLDDFESFPIQVHTTTFVLKRAIQFRSLAHMSIGKRVTYHVKDKYRGKMRLLNQLYNFDEYGMLPLSKVLSPRSLKNWFLRWREIVLYMQLLFDKFIRRNLDFSKYLTPMDVSTVRGGNIQSELGDGTKANKRTESMTSGS